MPSADPNRQKLTQLRKLLIHHFSLNELRVLCFDLGLEYEELPDDTRTTKMHSLIEYLQRRGELSRLLNEAIDHRPNVTWPTFEDGKSTAQKDEPVGSPQSFIHEKSGLEMLLIPAGEFLYSESKELKFLPNFWIAKAPVTNANYIRFVNATGYESPAMPSIRLLLKKKSVDDFSNLPVVNISWADAVAYSEWAQLNLPTQEQWEKAARGSDGRSYPWGNVWKPYYNSTLPWFFSPKVAGYYSPFGDSPYGCVDMVGNIWEWTSSFESLEKRVLRGGILGTQSFKDGKFSEIITSDTVTTCRIEDKNFKDDNIGFRVVHSGYYHL